MLLKTILAASLLIVAQNEPKTADGPVKAGPPPVKKMEREKPDESFRPIFGPREKLAMGMLRALMPPEKQDTYDDVAIIVEGVLTSVDKVREKRIREVRQRVRRSEKPIVKAPEGRPPEQAGPRQANGRVLEKLMQQKRMVEETLQRERRALEERVNKRREDIERQAEMQRREAVQRREEMERRERGPGGAGHANPFRGRSEHGERDHEKERHGDHRPREQRLHEHEHDEHNHDDHDHEHGERELREAARHERERLEREAAEHAEHEFHVHMEMLERETHAARMEAERMEAAVHRMGLRTKTVAEYEPSAIWAVERLIEVFREDARGILIDLKHETRSEVVRRYINVRLAEMAEMDRDLAVDPLRELILGDDRGRGMDERRPPGPPGGPGRRAPFKRDPDRR